MQKIRALFATIFLSTFLFSQQSFIKGVLADEKTGDRLPGVSVRYADQGTVSDLNGEFVVSGSANSAITFEIEYVGYTKKTLTANFPAADTLTIEILLSGLNEVLQEVVVSAGKFEQKLSEVTVSMEVIKPSLVENKNTTSLEFFMNQVPSVSTYDGQISIRNGSGFSYGAGSRVLVLVDELPMISADAGDIKWNYLPVENMEQVEVLKGAASALFGSSALNGVINFRTAYAKDKPSTSATFYSGFYDKPKRESLRWWEERNNPVYNGMNFTHSQKLGQWDLVLGGHLFSDEGFRQGETEQRKRGNVNLRYRFKKIQGLSAGVNFNSMNTVGGLFFLWKSDSLALQPKEGTIQQYDNWRLNVDPFIVYYTEKAGKHSLRTRYYKTNNINDKDQSSLAELYYAEYQFQKKFKRDFTFTSGLVYMDQKTYSDSIYGLHKGQNRALYVQADKKFFKKLTVSLGIRGEYYKVDTAETRGELSIGKSVVNDLPFQPVVRIGTNYQAFEYTFVRASFGQGYRFPSIAEKFVNTTVSSLKIIPNPSLQPERGYSAEIGIKQGFRIYGFRGFVDVAGYITEYKNMIEFVFGYYYPSTVTSPTFMDIINYAGFKSINQERGKISGIDVSVTGKGKINKVDIAMIGGYTYSKPINPYYDAAADTISPGTTGTNLLKYRTQHMFKNDIQLDWKGFSLGWSIRYNSRMENIDKRFEESIFYDKIPGLKEYILTGLKEYRENEPDGFWFNDFRLSYSVSKHLKLMALVNNAFNTEYAARPGYLIAPRTFVMQMSLKM